MNKLFWPLLLVLPLLASTAFAGDFVIVPGQRIGMVTLGMSRTSAHTLLHPPSTTHRAHGLILDTWLSHQLLTTDPNGDRGLKRDYLTVFFRNSHAVQIEVSSPKFKTANGLSARSSANDFKKHYLSKMPRFPAAPLLNWGDFHYNETAVDPDGSSPAAKHYLYYGEALLSGESRTERTLGIAWKYGAWGDLAPEPDPNGPLEAVIVHVPGQTVLLNPNDGLPYSGTGPARK